ncbi:MAG TPA: hypothetical protein VFN25_03540 [Dokdonella sp.]|uniref:hypothetical protein n=1 Tax=Dokdonella sp. TaxID=2291710 RepID=UPI002D7E3530|nr:hypothetical protein [Dokdonella sp.]HET9031960.1 hypothetical protein [Dokdonella sp.]
MRTILIFTMLGLAGLGSNATASDRIFANGFEPCCTLGGEVSGLSSSGLVLHLAAGAVSENKNLAANGGQPQLYTFAKTASTGSAYTVTITTQPGGQICTLSNASGSIGSTPVDDINVTCVAGPPDLNWDDGAWDDADWQ